MGVEKAARVVTYHRHVITTPTPTVQQLDDQAVRVSFQTTSPKQRQHLVEHIPGSLLTMTALSDENIIDDPAMLAIIFC